jgi:uncharacterized protein YjeT (DUF2065 family)
MGLFSVDSVDWFLILINLGYGLFYVFWPDRARKQFLAHFDVDGPTKWYRPNTYLTFKPPAVVFRIVGIALVCLSVLLFFLLRDSR